MTHTPSPWYFDNIRHVRESATDICIAHVYDDTGHPNIEHTQPLPQESNARLIAAAPDLLAACELALTEGDDHIAIEAIKAAIKKAKGEP